MRRLQTVLLVASSLLGGTVLNSVWASGAALMPQGYPDPSAKIEWTFADVLRLESSVMTMGMQAALRGQADVDSATIDLLELSGKTSILFLLKPSAVATLQVKPPAQQMKEFAGVNRLMWAMFSRLAAGDVPAGLASDFAQIKSYPAPLMDMVSSFLRSRKPDDFVLRIGFVQDGDVHLYVTVSGDKVEFNPTCPQAKR